MSISTHVITNIVPRQRAPQMRAVHIKKIRCHMPPEQNSLQELSKSEKYAGFARFSKSIMSEYRRRVAIARSCHQHNMDAYRESIREARNWREFADGRIERMREKLRRRK